jgi:hypothetical protein
MPAVSSTSNNRECLSTSEISKIVSSFGKTVVILGAGASRGSRVEGKLTPPLDTEFLTVAQNTFRYRRARGSTREAVRAWKKFKEHLQKAGLKYEEIKSWRLEQLSTFLEARSNLQGLQLSAGRPREYAQALAKLKEVVGHTLMLRGGVSPCQLHQMLFKAIKLKSVISFNYDLIADQTLLRMRILNWQRSDYRGSEFAQAVSNNGDSYSKKIRRARVRQSIPLIKLHGSIHWQKLRRGDGYRISGCRLPDANHSTFQLISIPQPPYIIPPVAAKIEIKEDVLRKRWYSAVAQLHGARTWIIWGYSFPQTDTIAQVMFRTALSRNRKSKRVIVVNPDASASSRVSEVCQKVSVEQFPSMEAFLVELGKLRNSESAGENGSN